MRIMLDYANIDLIMEPPAVLLCFGTVDMYHEEMAVSPLPLIIAAIIKGSSSILYPFVALVI